jgi:hypothetical protein
MLVKAVLLLIVLQKKTIKHKMGWVCGNKEYSHRPINLNQSWEVDGVQGCIAANQTAEESK